MTLLAGQETEGGGTETSSLGLELWEAWRVKAAVTGGVSALHFTLAKAGTGTETRLALCEEGEGKPGAVMAEGGVASTGVGTHEVAITETEIKVGTSYWLARLPLGGNGGTVKKGSPQTTSRSVRSGAGKHKKITEVLAAEWAAATTEGPTAFWATGVEGKKVEAAGTTKVLLSTQSAPVQTLAPIASSGVKLPTTGLSAQLQAAEAKSGVSFPSQVQAAVLSVVEAVSKITLKTSAQSAPKTLVEATTKITVATQGLATQIQALVVKSSVLLTTKAETAVKLGGVVASKIIFVMRQVTSILIGQEAEGAGAEVGGVSTERADAWRFKALHTGAVEAVHVTYSGSGTGSATRIAIQADNAGTPREGVLSEGEFGSTAAGTHEATVPPFGVTEGTEYWIVHSASGGTSGKVKKATAATGSRRKSTVNHPKISLIKETEWNTASTEGPISMWATGRLGVTLGSAVGRVTLLGTGGPVQKQVTTATSKVSFPTKVLPAVTWVVAGKSAITIITHAPATVIARVIGTSKIIFHATGLTKLLASLRARGTLIVGGEGEALSLIKVFATAQSAIRFRSAARVFKIIGSAGNVQPVPRELRGFIEGVGGKSGIKLRGLGGARVLGEEENHLVVAGETGVRLIAQATAKVTQAASGSSAIIVRSSLATPSPPGGGKTKVRFTATGEAKITVKAAGTTAVKLHATAETAKPGFSIAVQGSGIGNYLGLGFLSEGSNFYYPQRQQIDGATQFALGGANAAVFVGNVVWSWGVNVFGSAGHGDQLERTFPLKTNLKNLGIPENEVAQVAAYGSKGVIVLKSGRAAAWGGNASFTLGLGDDESPKFAPHFMELSKGVLIENIKEVRAGNFAVYLLTDTGTVYRVGRLQGGPEEAVYPTLISDENTKVTLTGVKTAIGYLSHALFLMNDGSIRTKGANFWGQLGNGEQTEEIGASTVGFPIETPVMPEKIGGGGGPLKATQIAAGEYHNLVLLEDGTIAAWGLNNEGQLGNGEEGTGNVVLVPTRTTGLTEVVEVAAAGAQINVTQIGGQVSMARNAKGEVFAWGANGNGQLGDGTKINRSKPTRTFQGYTVRQISTGYDHSGALVETSEPAPISIQAIAGHEAFTCKWLLPPEDAVESWTMDWRRVAFNPGFYHLTANTAVGGKVFNLTGAEKVKHVANGLRAVFQTINPGTVTGITVGTTYWVHGVLVNSFELSKDEAGTEPITIGGAELIGSTTEIRFFTAGVVAYPVSNQEAVTKTAETNKMKAEKREETVTKPALAETWPNALNLLEVKLTSLYTNVHIPISEVTQKSEGGEQIKLKFPDTLHAANTTYGEDISPFTKKAFKEPSWTFKYRRKTAIGGQLEPQTVAEVETVEPILQLTPWFKEFRNNLSGPTAIGASKFNLTGAVAKGTVNGKRVKFTNLPVQTTVPVLNTLYYIINASESGFEVSLTEGGVAVKVAGHEVTVSGTTVKIEVLNGEEELEITTTLKGPEKLNTGIEGNWQPKFGVRITQVLPELAGGGFGPEIPYPIGGPRIVPTTQSEAPTVKPGDIISLVEAAPWENEPVESPTYQWTHKTPEHGEIPKEGETGLTYVVRPEDVGFEVRVQELVKNAHGVAYLAAISEPSREVKP